MSSIEISVVPTNETQANLPASPESGEGRNQPEEMETESDISVSDSEQSFYTAMQLVTGSPSEHPGLRPKDSVQDRLRELMHFRQATPAENLFHRNTELKKYFKPRILSFGPIYHGKIEFNKGQNYKDELARTYIGNCPHKEELYDNILKKIESFKNCYAAGDLPPKLRHNDEDLAWVFFVDGCALIQLVHDWFDSNIADNQLDLILTRDLLLLDNQLPLGVLNLVMDFGKEGGELYQNDHSDGKQSNKFRQSFCQLIEVIEMTNFKRWENGVKADFVRLIEANHLLELIWMDLVKKENDSGYVTKAPPRQFRSVKDLQAAGIILEPDNSSSSLRDISFIRGTFFCKLKIPRFRVSEEGTILVFNLIAFEMRKNFEKDRVVTSYISFLNSLVATKEDVAELRKAGILLNYLSNDEDVLKTFRELTSRLKPYSDIFSSTKKELIDYFNDKKSMTSGKWLSEAMHVYFRSPWTTIAFVSATFLLIFTIIQAIFSVLAYQRRSTICELIPENFNANCSEWVTSFFNASLNYLRQNG